MDSPRTWTLARWFLVIGSIVPMIYITIFTGLAWLGFGPTPFFLIPMALIGVIGGIWWPNRWLMLVPGIIGTLSAVADIAGTLAGQPGDPGVFRPDRTLEFSYWWLATIDGIALLVAGIAWFRQSRARAAMPSASAPRASALAVALVVLAAALWVGGLVTALELKQFAPAAEGSAVGFVADKEVALAAPNDKWSPDTMSFAAGNVVKVNVTNKDSGSHVFNQDDGKLRLDLSPGATKTVWLRFPTAGTYQWYCELHSSVGADGKRTGMVGTITVT